MGRLSEFAMGYLECATWTEADELGSTEWCESEMLRVAAEADAFADANRSDLDIANKLGRDDAHLGHDFWLTRNGHGTGFWDRDLGAVGDRLSEAARKAGERDLCIGDDGRIHCE